MPQATGEQRALMKLWFGYSTSEDGPYFFLRARGWTEIGGLWQKPTSFHNPSIYEVECLLFLRNEWDYDFRKPLFQQVR